MISMNIHDSELKKNRIEGMGGDVIGVAIFMLGNGRVCRVDSA